MARQLVESLASRGVRAREVPRPVPRAAARSHRAQGVGRGDHRRAADRAAGQGARPRRRARSVDREVEDRQGPSPDRCGHAQGGQADRQREAGDEGHEGHEGAGEEGGPRARARSYPEVSAASFSGHAPVRDLGELGDAFGYEEPARSDRVEHGHATPPARLEHPPRAPAPARSRSSTSMSTMKQTTRSAAESRTGRSWASPTPTGVGAACVDAARASETEPSIPTTACPAHVDRAGHASLTAADLGRQASGRRHRARGTPPR